jgi:hypothetical protein
MSARNLRRVVTIELEIDPALVPARADSDDPLVAAWTRDLYAHSWRLRLVPCAGGVRLARRDCAQAIHRDPGSLAAALGDLALDAAVAANDYLPPCATRVYWEDRMWFYLLAARAVREDPRILRLWGLES